MYYLYVLKSKKDGRLYIGTTADLKKRLGEHNTGYSRSTRLRRPFAIIYSEIYRSKSDALIREKKLKKFKNSYNELIKRIPRSLELE